MKFLLIFMDMDLNEKTLVAILLAIRIRALLTHALVDGGYDQPTRKR